MRGMWLAVLVALLGSMVLTGCGGPAPSEPGTLPPSSGTVAPPEGATLEPEDGDWMLRRMPVEMPHLNPVTSTGAYASRILTHIFDSLLQRDWETLEILPQAAESWEIAEDHLSYTFHLRKGMLFSDGKPVTAEDVKFSFDIMMDPTTDAPHIRNYYKDITECVVVDEHTIQFIADKPYYLHLLMLGDITILPRHIYGVGEFNKHPNNRSPIGSGMYTLESWETGLQLELKRNPNYWGKAVKGTPYIDKLIYKFISNDDAAFQVLSRGDLDVLGMPPKDWVRRANTDKFKAAFNKYEVYRPAYNYLGYNLRKPMFSDKMVRRAMTMLLDRQLICDEVMLGYAEIVTGNFMPGTPAYNDAITAWPFDPAQAQVLLDEAGWKDRDGDGLRDKEGQPFRFEAFTTNDNPIAEKILTIFKEELARVGIELNIRQMEWASLLERIHGRDFDAMVMGWSMPPDPDPYQVWHSSQTDAGSNYVGFVNEEADKIIEDARQEFDAEKRNALYRRFHEIVHEEQPYSFMFMPKALFAVDKRVHGITLYPFHKSGADSTEWFVPKALQRYGLATP